MAKYVLTQAEITEFGIDVTQDIFDSAEEAFKTMSKKFYDWCKVLFDLDFTGQFPVDYHDDDDECLDLILDPTEAVIANGAIAFDSTDIRLNILEVQ